MSKRPTSVPSNALSRMRRLLVMNLPMVALSAPSKRATWAALAAMALPARAKQAEASLLQELRNRRLPSDALKVDFPPVADSGLTVPYVLDVTSPPGRKLQSIEVLAPLNPAPLALRIRLAKPQAAYRLSTRLRLAASQEVWAVATFDDGSQQAAGAATLVMASACLDDT